MLAVIHLTREATMAANKAYATSDRPTRLAAVLACAVIISGTVLGLSGMDLVLPAVPSLPDVFDTSVATAQLVLALYVAGSAIGLLAFGSLAAHIGRRRLFILSLVLFAVSSAISALSTSIEVLNITRFLQGAAASGPAVLAPGLIRNLFSELGAIRAIAAMGSIESLTPGLAPILGAWLFSAYGWEASFTVTAALTGLLVLIILMRPSLLPSIGTKQAGSGGSYGRLLKNPTYLRYALGHALVLGGLLTFVFSAPAVIVQTMDGTIDDFIIMQVVGVTTFIISANVAGHLVARFGVERVIMAGAVISVTGTIALLTYSLFGQNDPTHLKYLFWLLNVGLGVRGGPGFVRALSAAEGDDDRASALLIFFVTMIASGCTALVAPFITTGLWTLTLAVFFIVLPSLLLMLFIAPYEPPAEEPAEQN